MKDAPCKTNGINCPDRHPLCWNDCERYKEWKDMRQRAADNRLLEQEKNKVIWNRKVRQKK